MAKTVEIKRDKYFAVRVTEAEIPAVRSEYGYDPRKIILPQSDPIMIIGRFTVRGPADSLAADINELCHGAKKQNI